MALLLLATQSAWAGEQVCMLAEDCETGGACVAFADPRTAWVRPVDGGVEHEIEGNVVVLTELAHIQAAQVFAGTPGPNNTLLLMLHDQGGLTLTAHYSSGTEILSNTLRGTCRTESN
ncbi:hypothetical protein [Tabrizicola sp.]|uniref:hypothetical protein n=1 Tax=Tabrizicola sp. TaxID=2005166 RepID=UPI00273437E3|nr:hypothetical protein [Tabrizicola sp.]MDP3196514.1 hypothetical protein [Tabrizicola sp.]